ncbi:nucleoside triphosphate hydrolase [Pseudorhodobacter sp. MZDSW-24AT]|uniref:nucleoside triphosphate hydrolase n=1 Tax=Pseudorhodobacter sp. MZDSW-24AT TaxID=2052957 RepID=UPI000C1F7E1D|nr:nucleoside triphosphate hydrolase [Pseudorhodobacter sp. MZDSW-24AT]PJF11048.1 nucleoside/nucleotide kinase family protein [Pseudorhodobacter sp. MZDSW-24AT]
METQALAEAVLGRMTGARMTGARMVVAIAGAPGAGKSTLAEALCDALNQRQPGVAVVMPMDGYHLDNALLDARGLRDRKGSPPTFDVDGLARDLARVRAADRPVILPVFDRDLDLARAGAREVGPEVPIIVIEGNYLLLDQAPWRDLAPMFDMTVFVEVPEAELERRLVARWLHYGHAPEAARARALSNDIPNARLVVAHSRAADVTLRQDTASD